MDKTEQFSEAIYATVMENLYQSLLRNLSSDIEFCNKNYKFIKSLYKSFNNDEKEMFNNYIKSILDDCTSTVLADFDGVADTAHYPCQDIKILCGNEKIDPWVQELFTAISQEKNPEIF